MDKTIGFIGFGEAAYHIAKGFHAQGIGDMLAFDVVIHANDDKKTALESRLAETGVAPVSSVEALMRGAGVVFLAVPAKFARDTAMEALPFLTEDHLFADITTNRPAVKEELGKAFAAAGRLYADASVMGAVPLYQHRTPILVSGNGAGAMISLMAPVGMDLKDVGPEPGRAVKMKLTRSIFIKGIEALTLEMLLTARRLGIEDEIMEGLEDSFRRQGFTKLVSQLVTSDVLHAGRRALEAQECMELEEEIGMNSIMMEAAKRKLQWSADLGFGGMSPAPDCASLEDLYGLWEKYDVCKQLQN